LTQNIFWKPGETVLLRGVWREKLWFAIVAYIVQDTDDLIALYWHAGTPNRLPGWRITGKDFLVEKQPKLIASTWTRTNLLMLAKPGETHSIELMWDGESGEFLCWYVNLQEPLRRTPLGFDTMDLALDVVINPDRSKWRWKDENEFAGLIELGLVSSSEAKAIRSEGERVIQMAETNQSPFCDGWENWSAPEDWEIPEFPPDWDQIDFD
jgi:predicted RNA-binding protein associated with RNAse of E/G family